MIVLAFLMPIVASMGGNAGMQTLAVTVRTLTNDVIVAGADNAMKMVTSLKRGSGVTMRTVQNLNQTNKTN